MTKAGEFFKDISRWNPWLQGAIGIIIALIVIFAVWFLFFSVTKCQDIQCYLEKQRDCSSAEFIRETEKTIWGYRILEEQEGKCFIEVKVLEIRDSPINKQALEGNSMICELPSGSVAEPEADLSQCHGILREQIQEMIIQNLHKYVLENIDDIKNSLAVKNATTIV